MLLYSGVIVFVLIITSILSFAAYYETSHFDENHGLLKKRKLKKVRHRH